MKKLRWSTTLLFLATAVALVSTISFLDLTSSGARMLFIAAILMMTLMLFFGRRGV